MSTDSHSLTLAATLRAPILVDVTHTSHSRARTGVQRVARALATANGAEPICHDRYANAWRPLESAEVATLKGDGARPGSRGARWTLRSRLSGVFRRQSGDASVRAPAEVRDAGLIVPEIFSPEVARALPALFASVSGPRAAVFHDAIALKLPELAPPKTVARFPAYLRELLLFDGIAATSDDSRDALLGFWRWLRVDRHPPVQTIPLGIDPASPGGLRGAGARKPGDLPLVLSVGTIEGRKNHLALLKACESLWSAGLRFELQLVGLPRPETAAAALDLVRVLQGAGRPVRCDGPATDAELEAAYAACTFTVYPSLMEGFGLPVLESVARGKPCICSSRGALGESARGGGCVALAEIDAQALAAAIRRLVENPAEIAGLAEAARRRKFKEWRNYAEEVSQWIWTLKRA